MQWIMKGLRFLFSINSWDYTQKILEMEKSVATAYFGYGVYVIFYVIACLYLFYKRPDMKKKLLYPILLLILMFVIPKTSSFIVAYMFETSNVYWRYFWLLQINLLISIAITEFFAGKGKRAVLGVGFSLVILALSGKFVFNGENFQQSENAYKIPQEVIEICGFIKVDAGDRYLIDELTVAPAEIAGWIRMYDGDICLLYGRHATYTYTKNEDTETINAYLSQGVGDMESVLDVIESNQCTYLVISNKKDVEAEAMERMYRLLGKTDNYMVFRVE